MDDLRTRLEELKAELYATLDMIELNPYDQGLFTEARRLIYELEGVYSDILRAGK